MDVNLARFLYEENSLGIFVLVTLVLGGGTAWLTGRAVAVTWRPLWQVLAYTLVLGLVVRFLHFALFGGTLLSLHYYLVDTAACLLFGLWGYRTTRRGQMVSQYRWLYRPAGLFGWSKKPRPNAAGSESG